MIHNKIIEKHEARKGRIRKDLELYGAQVLESEEMKQAFQQSHHRWSTVGEHTLRVAFTSVMVCYALKKLNIKVNVPAVIVGALCHDLGILGREDKFSTSKEMSREHPKASVDVAKDLLEELPEKTEDIIERHMWPAGHSKAPNSIEGVIVSAADKYNAVKDIVKGSEVLETGVKYMVRDEKDKIKDMIIGE